MFEQDYVMRLIREMVRAILKLLFQVDTDSPMMELLEDSEEKALSEALMDMVDEGRIDEAENMIYELTESPGYDNLKVALLFYAYLNDKSDAFLEENHFSREEVKQGVENIASRYGLGSMADVFL